MEAARRRDPADRGEDDDGDPLGPDDPMLPPAYDTIVSLTDRCGTRCLTLSGFHIGHAVISLTSASTFNIEPNCGFFDVSPQNERTSPNVKTLSRSSLVFKTRKALLRNHANRPTFSHNHSGTNCARFCCRHPAPTICRKPRKTTRRFFQEIKRKKHQSCGQ